MIEIIVSGGWMMIPILLGSVVALGIIFERIWFLRARRILDERWIAPIWQNIVKTGEHHLPADKMQKLKQRGFMGSFVHSLFISRSRSQMEQMFEYESQQLESILKNHLHLLGTIAMISPLMGLLGTVMGIIEVFQKMATASADIDPALLSNGISIALITTAAGLIVSIPATFFHRYLINKADTIFSLFQRQGNLFIDALSSKM